MKTFDVTLVFRSAYGVEQKSMRLIVKDVKADSEKEARDIAGKKVEANAIVYVDETTEKD